MRRCSRHLAPRVCRHLVPLATLAAVLITLGAACHGTLPPPEMLRPIPQGPAQDPQPLPAGGFDDPGFIFVHHGSACGESARQGEPVTLDVSEPIPAFAPRATVFVNGWRLDMLGGDIEVSHLGVALTEIERTADALEWKMHGWIRDRKYNDRFEACIHYTVLAWQPASVHAEVDDGDGGEGDPGANANGTYSFFTYHEETALLIVPSYTAHEVFVHGNGAAILPRGFAFGWEEGFNSTDHDLLQLAWATGPAAFFVENADATLKGNGYRYRFLPEPVLPSDARYADTAFISWEAAGIFKDDKDERDSYFNDYFSTLGGGAVGVIAPPFAIVPKEDVPGDGGSHDRIVRREEIVIENVPFRYAVPVLAGWDLFFAIEDERVQEIGIWLEEIDWSYDEAAQNGRLSYTVASVLRDDDGAKSLFRHNVHILGLDRATPPDLVPVPGFPDVPGPSAYCERGPGENEVVVHVGNRGESAAGASTVRFEMSDDGETVSVSAPVPALEAGEEVALMLVAPRVCGTDCLFRIVVDAEGAVTESFEGNNTADGHCVG